MKRLFAFLVALVWAGVPALAQDDAPATIFAAASLRGALEDALIGAEVDARISYGGSGAMARQVAQGAPADLVILASPLWMNWLSDRGIVAEDAARNVAGNQLVLIGPAGAPPLRRIEDLDQRLGTGRLAMGQRTAVPAGAYATEWLQAAGVWQLIENRLAETENVRAALALVARGETTMGVVYATDAAADATVAVLFDVPDSFHSPITYPAAALTDRGASLLAHLQQEGAAAAFAAHGFTSVAP